MWHMTRYEREEELLDKARDTKEELQSFIGSCTLESLPLVEVQLHIQTLHSRLWAEYYDWLNYNS